ncbi:hypothetical protein BIWAKO_06651 [Bosea sp. BIWAKO-01]|nr:hypothetical protein BIWAKO_06651 [Bosea sp. BIWAKO-01]
MAEIEDARPDSDEAEEWADIDYAAFCWEEDHQIPAGVDTSSPNPALKSPMTAGESSTDPTFVPSHPQTAGP